MFNNVHGGSDSKESACNAGGPGSIPGSGRFPREGNGDPLQHSCLENPMDRGAWWTTVHGRVAKSWTSQTWLNEWALAHTHTHAHMHAHTTYKKWRSLGSAGWFGDLNVLFTCFKLSAAGRSSHPTILTSPYSGPQNLAINCATWIHVTGWGSYFTTACQRQLDFLLGLCA